MGKDHMKPAGWDIISLIWTFSFQVIWVDLTLLVCDFFSTVSHHHGATAIPCFSFVPHLVPYTQWIYPQWSGHSFRKYCLCAVCQVLEVQEIHCRKEGMMSAWRVRVISSASVTSSEIWSFSGSLPNSLQ